MAIRYDWDIETIDTESEDILDHDHSDTLAPLLGREPLGPDKRLVLVRDRGNDLDGLQCRSWAYVENGKLPAYFTNASGNDIAKVPAKFHNELKRES